MEALVAPTSVKILSLMVALLIPSISMVDHAAHQLFMLIFTPLMFILSFPVIIPWILTTKMSIMDSIPVNTTGLNMVRRIVDILNVLPNPFPSLNTARRSNIGDIAITTRRIPILITFATKSISRVTT